MKNEEIGKIKPVQTTSPQKIDVKLVSLKKKLCMNYQPMNIVPKSPYNLILCSMNFLKILMFKVTD